jgi:hypothetical protein
LPPDRLRGTIERQLLPGERLIWVGQPDPDVMAREVARGFAAVCGVIGLVSLGAIWAASTLSQPRIPVVVACLVVGALVIGLIVSAPWGYRARLLDTIYAITDRRALVYHGIGWSLLWLDLLPELHETLWSFDATTIQARRRLRRYTGRTDLVFDGERHYHFTGKGAIRDWVQVGFLGLRDVDEADELLERQFPWITAGPASIEPDE